MPMYDALLNTPGVAGVVPAALARPIRLVGKTHLLDKHCPDAVSGALRVPLTSDATLGEHDCSALRSGTYR